MFGNCEAKREQSEPFLVLFGSTKALHSDNVSYNYGYVSVLTPVSIPRCEKYKSHQGKNKVLHLGQ